jgi:hypothetical protein
MAGIAVSTRVIARNDMGQFIAACERAATETVREAIKDGERAAKQYAPRGSKRDPRTVTLREGMYSRMLGATSGEFGCIARHALDQEFGAGPHPITGRVSFWWDAMGRAWTPGSNMIQHPGNPAQPYLRPAYALVMARVMRIAAAKYPG